MAAPVVVIEMPAADRASPYIDALVRTCSDSVAQGRCLLASDRDEPDVSAVAIVAWTDAERRVVEVSVGLRGADRAKWLARRIEFRDADAMRERWRAVGLVIATLAGESQRAAEAEQTTPESAAPPAASPAPAAPAETAPAPPATSTPPAAGAERPSPRSAELDRERAWLDAGGVIDPGFGGWFHGGAWLRGSLRPTTLPLFVLVAGRYAVTAGDDRGLSQRFLQGSAGAGTMFTAGAVRLELHAAVVVESVRATATDPLSGSTDSASRWVGGGRIEADAAWSPSRAWAIVGGLETDVFSSGTELRVLDERRGRDPALRVGALLGARAIFR